MASPQVRTIEYDLSQRVPSFEGMYGLMIGNFDKGPVGERTFISSNRQADIVLGKPTVGSDVAYYSMHSYLTKSKRMWAVRVAPNALYGGVRVGASYNAALGTGDGTETDFTGTVAMSRCLPGSVTVYVDQEKVGYDDASGDINGTNLSGTVDYETGAVSLTFTEAPPDSSKVYVRWGFDNESFTTGIEDPTVHEFDGRDLAVTLTSVDTSYSDTLVPGTLVAPTGAVAAVEDATVVVYDDGAAIAYADENGDLVDIAGTTLDGGATNNVNYASGAIQFTLDGAYSVVGAITVEYKSTGADLFIVVGDNPGAWTDNFKVLIDKVDVVNNEFDVIVYETDERNIDRIMERYTLSREFKTDGFERQMNLEERVNGRSYYIRFADNPDIGTTDAIPSDCYQHNSLVTTTPVSFGGGDAGTAPSVSDYINILKTFNNREEVKVDIVIDTLADEFYQLEIAKLCDRDFGGRGDCYGIVYVPYELETSNNFVVDMTNYRKYTLNLSTSFVGLYAGHVKIYDSYNGRPLWIPNVGFVAAAFSYTADQFEPWFPAAGWRRGMLPVVDVNRRFSLGERDVLYDNDINAIRFRPGKGIAIWGQKTLYGRPSALDRANVRWLLIVIENAIEEFLEEYTFELNDYYTRALVRTTVWDYLASIKSRRGLYDYDVVCDETNNTPEQIDNYIMNIDYYVQPVKAAEYIYGRAVITRTGINFADVRIQ